MKENLVKPTYNIDGFKKKPVYEFVKRFLDILLSALALILLSPIFAIIAIWIKIDDSKGPVIYV